eukprot:CAMPEP_0197279038 /NCGR_PEP_ID=MMETSP1432-20130617/19486_1 /TAXON_ID=44447 /ORGANISM="Pseudo-nitzschia delicatissima, Strain UNC1205" /LENGTH=299 /DNA_ID=CAMNT_0042745499 /DNA_START=28 /DNA_END=927 /DNA_ORIENTATION=+
MNTSVEQTLETIHAMRRQEELAYSVSDYLSCLPQTNAALETPVDASCRQVMAKWCDEIAAFCDYKRETVAIAMNCLDRFMQSPSGHEVLLDRNQYQLAAMTALYSSVKIHEQEAMDPRLVSTLSRGVHSAQAVEAMESKMLNAIKWRVNPPTAMGFVRSMIDLIPEHLMSDCEKATIGDISKLQIEMVTNEYKFCTVNASSIAYSCALNAMESVIDDGMLYSEFESSMAKTMMLDLSCVRDLRIAIYELMNNSDATNSIQMNMKSHLDNNNSSCTGAVVAKGDGIHSSPRTVATSVAQR